MKRAVIYLRVSTMGQAEAGGEVEGYSIPAQREACFRKAESLGAAVVDEYVDRGESAKTADRPQLLAMLERLRLVGDVDYVIVHKVDRLARNRADDSQIVLGITKAGAALVSVTENIDDTPEGKLLHGIMAVFAEHYSLNLAREATKGMRQKAKMGGTPNKAPVGYLNVRDRVNGREIRTVIVDPDRSPLVQWAFEQYATGNYSVDDITEELENRGLTSPQRGSRGLQPISRSKVPVMLKSRYYLGIVRFEGIEYPGKHEPLIDLQTFEKVQAVLEAHRHSGDRSQKHDHYLKGSIFCGYCGNRMIFSRNKGRHGGLYDYFSCLGRQRATGCRQPYVSTALIETKVEAFWSTLQLSAERRREIETAVRQHVTTARSLIDAEASRQKTRTSRLEKERRKLLEAHYDDAIAPALFKSEQTRITSALDSAQKILGLCQMQFDVIESNLDELLSLATDAYRLYCAAESTQRRLLNQAVYEHIWIIDDEVAGVDLQAPYAQVLSHDLPTRLEQEAVALQKGTYGDTSDHRPTSAGQASQTDQDTDQPLLAQHLGQALLTQEHMMKVAYPPYWGESKKRKQDKQKRELHLGSWEQARDSLFSGNNVVYLRTKPGQDIPAWINDPLIRPFGALPKEIANPEAITAARGSNVKVLVAGVGFAPVALRTSPRSQQRYQPTGCYL